MLVAWQAAALSGAVGSGLPTATATGAELARLTVLPGFWLDIAATVGIAMAGLAASTVIGVALGILIGSFEPFRAATLALFEFLKPIPPIVVLPLMVLVFGPTAEMAILLVVLGCALTITIQSTAGVHDTDPVALATARSYGLGRIETLLRITLPSALPFIGMAVRVSAPASLIIAVVAGLLGGAPGIGLSLYQAQAAGNYTTLYALVIVLGVLGLALQSASERIERRLLHWHPSHREGAL
ncbi:ABC transporter permease [Sinomonas halotolerans]